MKNKLSHSAISKYLECPKAYELHYKKRLRPNYASSALLFGSALDAAFNCCLTKSGDPYTAFETAWLNAEINGKKEFLPESLLLRYAESDFDEDVLTEEDYVLFEERINQLGFGENNPLELFKEIQRQKKEIGFENLHPDQIRIYNLMFWTSLKRKAKIMIDGYIKYILQRIKNVVSIQEKVALTNKSDDEIIGFIDIIADIELETGEVVRAILDNKTSSIDYSKDAVKLSQQLTLYADLKDIEFAGFIVIKKHLRKTKIKICSKCGYDGSSSKAKTCDNIIANKRCHGNWNESKTFDIDYQIIVDKVSDLAKDNILDTINAVNKAIKAGIFPRNYKSCSDWGGCAYYDLCHFGNNKNLIEVEEKTVDKYRKDKV